MKNMASKHVMTLPGLHCARSTATDLYNWLYTIIVFLQHGINWDISSGKNIDNEYALFYKFLVQYGYYQAKRKRFILAHGVFLRCLFPTVVNPKFSRKDHKQFINMFLTILTKAHI